MMRIAMKIIVNDKPQQLDDRSTVEQLLTHMELQNAACAVEVNRELVPKQQHKQQQLQDGDVVEVVTLVGGG